MKVARTRDLETCFALRHQVFVEEQGVPVELEQDELDGDALHLIATQDGTPVGTARVVIGDGIGKIGRVCVVQHRRGAGVGAALIRQALDELAKLDGVTTAKLGAQTDALGFYERLGFVAYGDVFDDAGLPHRMMSKPV